MVKNNLFNRYSFLKMTFFLSIIYVLISCDRMFPPDITNGYKYDIIINITYNNKSQTRNTQKTKAVCGRTRHNYG